jgi:tRNA(Ile)-lysidine synthase
LAATDPVAAVRAAAPDDVLGVAVSGGSDSVALLHAALDAGRDVAAATVDHRLRPGSRVEAEGVAALCARLGVPHDILTWNSAGTATGNLQARARAARYALLADWAKARGLATVAVGHTRDDQAETVVMALARAGGVDALAAMPARWQVADVMFLRPFLALSRANLRDWLSARGETWVEDPSNADPRFERVRVRRAMAALAEAGVGPAALARTAAIMAEVQAALTMQAEAAMHLVEADDPGVRVTLDQLAALPAEVRRRLLAACLSRVAGRTDAPRGAALARLTERLLAGRGGTLHGCRVTVVRGRVAIFPETTAGIGPATEQPH